MRSSGCRCRVASTQPWASRRCQAARAFGLQHRVEAPEPGVVDVGIARHHVEVAPQHRRVARTDQGPRMPDQPLEPGQFVVELGPRLRIAIGQVDRCHGDALHPRFEIPRLPVGVVIRQTAPHFQRHLPARQDRHTMVCALAVPHGAVTGGLDRLRWEASVVGLDLLQAGHVRPRFGQPFEQPRQAAVDPVDVECGDLQARVCNPGVFVA